MSFFSRLYETPGLSVAESKAESAHEHAERVRSELHDLKRRCDALTMGCQAMWELLRDNSGLSDETILEKIREIDLRDGATDGKISETAMKQCAGCGHVTHAARQICLYCGAPLPVLQGDRVFNKR